MNINELKTRLQQMNRRTTKQDGIWKPRDEHVVRCVRYPHGEDSFLEVYFHYDVGDQPVLCPKGNQGDECAICEFADALKAWKNSDGQDKPEGERKQDFELFKKIQAKGRIYIPMVERTKESEGVKFWGVTPNQASQILEVASDGDRLAELGISKDDAKGALRVLFDPDKAYDLTVSFAKPGEKGNTKTFTQITIKGKIKTTPLLPDKKAAAALVAGIKNIKDVFPPTSSDEVEKILAKFVGSSGAEAPAEGGTEKYPPKNAPTNSREDAKMVGGRTIDEAFEDMVKGA